ncbi:glycosyltransferase [Halomonas mongoliensis]|uniref:glycosyltransferase n=1 Tax=Halomonas mongoliensis TaxID=321265 RepID=UPI00403AE8B8
MSHDRLQQPIALFLPSLNGGGAERVFVKLANEFTNQTRAPVHLLLARGGGPFLREVSPRVRLIDFEKSRVMHSLPALVRYLRRERPRALLTTMSDCNVVALMAWQLAGRPCRIVIRETGMVRRDTPGVGRLRYRVLHWLMRRLYPRADAMVVIAKDILTSLQGIGVTPCRERHFIGNPVSMDEFDDTDPPAWLDELPANAPLICGVGRLVPVKGFDLLLDAFARVADERVHLVILGQGPMRDTLLARAQELGVAERFHLPGFVAQPRTVLARAELFVSSSHAEGFPNALMDALASGTPIVATACPGATCTILDGGRLGSLVPPADSLSLARAIEGSLKKPVGSREARLARCREFAPALIARRYLHEALRVPVYSGRVESLATPITGESI